VSDLLREDLFGQYSPVNMAIARLREKEPLALASHPDGYYLAFSGGKDSIAIKDLAIRAGVKFTAHMSLTTVDAPELLKYVKTHHQDVELIKPKTSMWKLIVEKMMPPTRRVRFCCSELKERSGKGRYVITGIRWAESVKRSKRKIFEQCLTSKTTQYVNPIIEDRKSTRLNSSHTT
jgi:phosphoadenosine phosphosulfate reductase